MTTNEMSCVSEDVLLKYIVVIKCGLGVELVMHWNTQNKLEVLLVSAFLKFYFIFKPIITNISELLYFNCPLSLDNRPLVFQLQTESKFNVKFELRKRSNASDPCDFTLRKFRLCSTDQPTEGYSAYGQRNNAQPACGQQNSD